jgi:anti-sigma factor RsiW
MNQQHKPVSEDELHAYVDGALGTERAAEVETWLAAHPEAAERVQAYHQQNHAMRALFDPVLNEPVPAPLTATLARRSAPWTRAAAAVAWLAVGGIAGYAVHGWQTSPAAATLFAERAAVAHVVYAAEVLHPVEVTAEQEQHLVKWLSKRLGKELHTPDFRGFGYQLVGGRLLPGDKGPAAQFMYQNTQGARLTLYVSTPIGNTQSTAFRYEEKDGEHVLYWVDRELGFALVGEPNRARLMDIAHLAYQAFNF